MTAIILESTLAALVIIGFISSVLCACACLTSGRISQKERGDV